MQRKDMIDRVGSKYHNSNVENGEYSYIKEAGSKENLTRAVGKELKHQFLDLRFEDGDFVLLIETKQNFTDKDEKQLADYMAAERALHYGKKIIGILANTNNDKIRVFKSFIDKEHMLKDETVLDSMEHYKSLFDVNRQNDREKVMKNTYALNELLHKMDIDERLRSQFVGTTLLYIKDEIRKTGIAHIGTEMIKALNDKWATMSEREIRAGIENTLNNLLDGSENKTKKIELLQKNVLYDQKVKKLTLKNWIDILDTIIVDIYKYIDADSSEGQDILNLFFIAFNKYTGKADKNQAFTPDHITDFMCRITGVDRTKRVFDGTCGSGSFLVQAMVKELADCRRGKTAAGAKDLQEDVRLNHIFGVEVEEKAYGLATTNMLIHGDGNSNIKFGDLFKSKDFIKEANPDIILMNPPYNAKPIGIPEKYKTSWSDNAKKGKTDPTKGFVFVHMIAETIKEMNDERERINIPMKEVKLAVLLPVATAIGSDTAIQAEKEYMLENNTLEAVFTLPNEIFYPGASASACCMLFTLGRPHFSVDGSCNSTFFGYCKDDGFKKKKSIGRIEQFDDDGKSLWKRIESEWIRLYKNKESKDGLSAVAEVDKDSEWLCEAYMKTDYSKLTEDDFQQTLNNYMSYLVKVGKVYES